MTKMLSVLYRKCKHIIGNVMRSQKKNTEKNDEKKSEHAERKRERKYCIT